MTENKLQTKNLSNQKRKLGEENLKLNTPLSVDINLRDNQAKTFHLERNLEKKTKILKKILLQG